MELAHGKRIDTATAKMLLEDMVTVSYFSTYTSKHRALMVSKLLRKPLPVSTSPSTFNTPIST